MNPLKKIEEMGLSVTWRLLEIGLCGSQKIPPVLMYSDIVAYLDCSLIHDCQQADRIITLLCFREETLKIKELIKEYAKQESSNLSLQQRKWRAYLLQSCLDSLSDDCLQGLMELMEFWISMDRPKESPFDFPKSTGTLIKQSYFTPSVYQIQRMKNYLWLNQEISAIQNEEGFKFDIFNHRIEKEKHK